MFYAYIVEGNKKIKVGQTNDFTRRLRQLKSTNNVEPRALFTCKTREDAEVIEALLRRYFIVFEKGERVGNDWIEGIKLKSDFFKLNSLNPYLKILGITKVTLFEKVITFKEIEKEL